MNIVNRLKTSVGFMARSALVLAAVVMPATQTQATDITVPNSSFESPVTGSHTLSFNSWAPFGGGFTATIKNGVYGASISGITGNQFGDIDGNVTGTGLRQDVSAQYTVGNSYTLTVDVATRQDNKVQSASKLRLSLRDSSDNVAAYTDVLGSQVNSIGANVATFTVNVPAVQNTDQWANHTIRIWFEDTVAAGGGDWVVDNVRLTSLASVLTVAVSSPTNNQTLYTGTPISAAALAEGGTPTYTVTYYTNVNGGAYASAGSAGTAPYAVSLGTPDAGTYGIYAAVLDSASGEATSVTNMFTVAVAVPTKLAITAVNGGASPAAGAEYSVTVAAESALGTPLNVTADTGVTLSLASGTPGSLGGTLTGTISNGSSSVTISGVTNWVAEAVTLQASTSSGTSLTAGTASYTIVPASAAILTVTGFPSPQPMGQAGSVTVTVKDAYGNITTNYTGTVTLSSSDSTATLPGNHAFTGANAGVYSFSGVILNAVGLQSITATDTVTGSVTGTQAGISVTVTPAVSTFTNVGTSSWTAPSGVTSVELLVVGGGGAGGLRGGGGGGGAGGLIYYGPETGGVAVSYPVTPGQTYTVTVGVGGIGSSGGDSAFGTVVAAGGGRGGSQWDPGPINPAIGGSGGGGGMGPWYAVAGAAASPAGQGYAGGSSSCPSGQHAACGGGGGGAGAIGTNGNTIPNRGGDGGAGLTYSISGSAVTYAGGGGAHGWEVSNGSGGPGYDQPGGGGMASWTGGRNAGMAGIVIVKYTPPPQGTLIILY
ncbi:MAG: glycine-rich domain-containing protein [bacterium]